MIAAVLLWAGLTLGGLPGENAYLKGHAAERVGRCADAIRGYEACAGQDAALLPYAHVSIARCRAKLGDAAGASAGYGEVLEKLPQGPWTRMARADLAKLLAKNKHYAEAAPLFAQTLNVTPQPWWMDAYAWTAGENALAEPSCRAAGFAYFRELAEAPGYVPRRLDAAKLLLGSAESEDRAAAILGMMRAGGYVDAGKALLASGVSLSDGQGGTLSLLDLAGLMDRVAAPQEAHPCAIEALAQANGNSPWLVVWLAYTVRKHAGSKAYDKAAATCETLVRCFPENREGAAALYWLGRYHGRAERPERALAAYQQLARLCPEDDLADDALFRAAGLLHAAGKLEEEEKTLLGLAKAYPKSRYCKYAYYVNAERRAGAGETKLARLYYAYAANTGLGGYYAHRALNHLHQQSHPDTQAVGNLRIDGVHSVLRPLPMKASAVGPLPEAVTADVRVQRLRFFGTHGLDEGEWEALDLCLLLDGRPDAADYYRALAEAGLAHTALQFAEARAWGVNGERKTLERQRLEYPRAYWDVLTPLAKEVGLDPYLILAAARQESTFRAGIQSHAGATGVMQIMPGTAKWLAKVDPNIAPKHIENLKSPVNSLRLGIFYLMRMVERSSGNLVYALAAYNAGPGNCDKWRKRFPNHDAPAFIEAIPFGETRDYVKRVLGNYAAYHSLYPPDGE